MQEAGAAVVIADGELTPQRLRAEVDAVAARREEMSAAARSLARPDAARDVAQEVLAAASAIKLGG
jgi:UDP-N-acetylglucosamine--N-acetylmuramyl-(pentapeptide) pyrophosphoryl-undecaprenol N-acetylglucosamine transferase